MLEDRFQLDRGNPHHLWLLTNLFLSEIQEDCERFQREWNMHPISTPGVGDKSPFVSHVLNLQAGMRSEISIGYEVVGRCDARIHCGGAGR